MTPFRTAIVGFGRIAAGYAADPRQARWYRYSSHAQALRAHPAFDWQAVVDPDPSAREAAASRWAVQEVADTAAALPRAGEIEVAVLAGPPASRASAIDGFPRLRAVVIEKPIAATLDAAQALLETCSKRGILVAVNLPRRYDSDLRTLAAGGLTAKIGAVQAVFGTYGNGLRNNGTHWIDLVRMLIGEVTSARAIEGGAAFVEGPLPGDVNVGFHLVTGRGLTCTAQPLRFSCYREVSMDMWGERGRLQLVHEGLTTVLTMSGENRQLSDEREIRHDAPEYHASSMGDALYRLYENVAGALAAGERLIYSGEDGLATMRIVEGLMADRAVR